MNNSKFIGDVLWFDPKRGYGFVSWSKNGEQQKDMFIHFSDIECEGFKTLYKGQRVAFNVGFNKNNVEKATDVEVLKN